jgi:predicted DCC family thiol-disulfide oxidoreductase YuxK
MDFYRALPGMKTMGDNFYRYIRDHRYQLFGQRNSTYISAYAIACETDQCRRGKG